MGAGLRGYQGPTYNKGFLLLFKRQDRLPMEGILGAESGHEGRVLLSKTKWEPGQ
ncbi:hypothetical protein COLO4_33427 [Corchorus olitorius]|uniref:Uncharacterized protein n=1 Tax=Corchorus olitorius TaxID=93759 RepID=A0A1R3GTL1_9ROSI|nr:hypothetical protein COLO4_33427 [Corchorus olitorius]